MSTEQKFIAGWLIIISMTYAFCGYYFTKTYQPLIEPVTYSGFILGDVLGFVINIAIWIINVITGLLSVMFFTLPESPAWLTIILNIFFIPINIIWFLNIYPYIKEFLDLLVEYAKALAQWADAIIPF